MGLFLALSSAVVLGCGVIGSPTGSGPVSLGSSPGTPAQPSFVRSDAMAIRAYHIAFPDLFVKLIERTATGHRIRAYVEELTNTLLVVEVHNVGGVSKATISTWFVLRLANDSPYGFSSTIVPGPRCLTVSMGVPSVVISHVLLPAGSAVGLKTIRSPRVPTEVADILVKTATWAAFHPWCLGQ